MIMNWTCLKSTGKRLACGATVGVLLSGCGGNSSSSNGVSGGDITFPAVTSHYFMGSPIGTSGVAAVGGLSVVKSDAAATPTVVDVNALSGYNSVTGGRRIATVKAGSKLSGIYDHAVVYASGGKLYKQYASAITPVQISNIADIGTGLGDGTANSSVNDLCYLNVASDFANPDSSVVMVWQAGADALCGNADDVHSWLRLSADNTTVPAALPGKILQPLSDANSGAISGFIGMNVSGTTMGNLVKYDANLANPVTIAAGPYTADAVSTIDLSHANTVLLTMLNGATTDLRMVDTTANTLSDILYSSTSPSSTSPQLLLQYANHDDTNFYFVDFYSNTVIRKFPLSGASAATSLVTAASPVLKFESTTNSVIYSTANILDGTSGIYSVAKTGVGATAVPLATGRVTGLTGDYVSLSGVSSTGNVFYNRRDVATDKFLAEVIREDGSGQQVYGTGTNASAWYSSFYSNRILKSIMLLEAANTGGATVSIVDASTAAKNSITQTALLPADLILNPLLGLGSDIQWPRGLMLGNFATKNDIFFIDSTVSNSLTRVTDTPGYKDLVW